MASYAWEGRSPDGGEERGVVQAPTRDAALKLLRGRGVLVVRLEETSGPVGAAAEEVRPPEPPGPPAVVRPGGASRRDRLFYVGVALLFAAIGVGTAAVAPVLRYECGRDAAGAVGCTVHRRAYGLIPLHDVRLDRLRAIEVETSSGSYDWESGRELGGGDSLVLVCADGTRWTSVNSSWFFGASNDDLAERVRALMDAETPSTFRAWQAEKMPILIGTVFLVPLGLVAVALLLRLVLPRSLLERKIADLERAAARRRPR